MSKAKASAALALMLWPPKDLQGTLWCLYYLAWIVNGLSTGQAPTVGVNPIYVGVAALFVTALCALNLGLGALALTIRPRHPILGTIASLVALLGVAGPLFAFFSRVLTGETMGGPAGMSVVGSCLAATLLGATTLRSGLLPRRTAGLLLALGLVTFPLVMLLGMVANLWLPAWVTDELPFAIAGAGWLLFGSNTRAGRAVGGSPARHHAAGHRSALPRGAPGRP